MTCKHWKEIPTCFSSKPICGFYSTGKFNKRNWNCKLLNDLRVVLGEEDGKSIWCNDQNIYIGTLGDEFWFKNWKFSHVFVSVYKSRGNTEGVWFLSSGDMIEATEEMVKKAIKVLKVKK
jgi:hypothetical protein